MTDLWPSFPETVRMALLARGVESWRQVYDGVATHNKEWRPLRPPIMTASAYRSMTDISATVARLILAACLRRATTAGGLRRALEMPTGYIDLLDEDLPLSDELLGGVRADILLADGTPYVVEANIDSALGGAHDSDGVGQRFLSAYDGDPVLSPIGLQTLPSAVDARYEAVRAALHLTGEDRLAMIFTTGGTYPGSQDGLAMIKLLEPFSDRGRQLGLDMRVFPVEWLTLDDAGRLCVDDGPIDAVLRMFVPQGTKPSAGLDALATAVRSGAVRMFTPTASWLLASKAIFAWLWDDLDSLSAEDAAVVRRHVPRTEVLSPDLRDRAIADQQRLVLKPSGAYGGVGVVVGPEVSSEAWLAALDAAIAEGGHILQAYIPVDRLTMQFVEMATGDVCEADVPFCIAPYLFGGTPSGAYLRFAVPGAGPVVNVGQGALTSGLLLSP
ncbi:circularly permuted ATPgrasp domain protein [Kribbella antiqua]|uniref:Circularly permuted ATPgrasp domain protein n=2 Tax=Kribbella antiqua TaxID=2512217 RepID=A0A4R2IVI3_9ACTN|nr:circularly permuted ATPgrasp domain protein [Kribbella antiqua]